MAWFRILFFMVLFPAWVWAQAGSLDDLVSQRTFSPGSPRELDFLPTGEINREILGVNAFGNQLGFGSTTEQFTEIRNTLGIRYVRVFFAWTDGTHPSPSSPVNFGFSDSILASLPSDVRAIAVLASTPSWMNDPSNWFRGDPRKSFKKYFFKPIVLRYRRKKQLEGIQIWNEPDFESIADNVLMEVNDSPENYLSMLKGGARLMRRRAKKLKIIPAATTSLFQNFPETLEYNEALKDLGMERFVDVWAIHLYGTSFERMYLGIGSFLNSLQKPIWVTESGRQGISNQLNYAQKFWPFLESEVPGTERIYHYRFTESTDPDETFGLKNTSSTQPTSDLYEHLRSQQ